MEGVWEELERFGSVDVVSFSIWLTSSERRHFSAHCVLLIRIDRIFCAVGFAKLFAEDVTIRSRSSTSEACQRKPSCCGSLLLDTSRMLHQDHTAIKIQSQRLLGAVRWATSRFWTRPFHSMAGRWTRISNLDGKTPNDGNRFATTSIN